MKLTLVLFPFLLLRSSLSSLSPFPPSSPSSPLLQFKEYLASQSGVEQSRIDRGDFLSLDGQELRFKCFWNNAGIHTDLLLRYFLSTREMMVMELGTFEGKDPFPTLFKRGQLPLDWRAIGAEPGGLPRGTLCYGPDQFRLGAVVDLYGRQVKLMKCDDFTRIWYKNKKNINVGVDQKCKLFAVQLVIVAAALCYCFFFIKYEKLTNTCFSLFSLFFVLLFVSCIFFWYFSLFTFHCLLSNLFTLHIHNRSTTTTTTAQKSNTTT